jgi:hypothetical protein
MARRTLSMQGRILAAGVTVAVGGALVGVMAAGDHTADASSNSVSVSQSNGSTGANATPYGDRGSDNSVGNGFPGDSGFGNSGFSPQPQTRTGGS